MIGLPDADWCLVCAPDGPSDPFGTPLLVVLDLIRVVVYIASFVIVVMVPKLIREVEHGYQRTGLAAFALVAFVAATTEIDHLGDYGHIRLFMNVAAVLFAVHAVTGFRTQRRVAVQRK